LFICIHVNNNPLIYTDPTGHFTCVIGPEGENAGITVEYCENWVNQTLDVLGLTETGAKIVAAFWEADAAAGEGGLTIMVGATILVPIPTSCQCNTFAPPPQEINLLVALHANAAFIGETMYLSPEAVLANPYDPENWEIVATFAHETVHAAQGFINAFSAFGEAEAYLIEYHLVNEMNALISDYNAGLVDDPRFLSTHPDYISPIQQHPLSLLVASYGEDWQSIYNLGDFRKQLNNPWAYTIYGWNFHPVSSGI
jgi:hypothetical protein